jgi:hypothetical protein
MGHRSQLPRRWDEMSEQTPGNQPVLSPLLPSDPPKVGDYWLDARIAASAAGVAFTAHTQPASPAMVILLSEGASADPAARDRFSGTVNQLHIDTVLARGGHDQASGRLGSRFRDEPDDPQIGDDAPATPWVALAFDGSAAAAAEAQRILGEVDLTILGLQSGASGPDYRLHWINRARPGIARIWPLPWPGRTDRAGWLSILASWLLMLLLCALAVLIAILLFQKSSVQEPPPPVPTSATSPESGSPPPTSGASASPKSASPSQSGSPSPKSASPSSSGQGSPTPNSKL